jgi:lactoylglutathione lyase
MLGLLLLSSARVAENEIAREPNDARLHDKFGYKLDVNDARTKAENVQKILDQHLSRQNWRRSIVPPLPTSPASPTLRGATKAACRLTPFLRCVWDRSLQGAAPFCEHAGAMSAKKFSVTAYEHVGIRVSDRDAAIAFYEKPGWRETMDIPEHNVNEMTNEAGVRINLIFNGARQRGRKNVLQDDPVRLPGFTHAASVIDNLDVFIEMCNREGIVITDGPVVYSDRRPLVFIRNLDGNVLEFNELFDE